MPPHQHRAHCRAAPPMKFRFKFEKSVSKTLELIKKAYEIWSRTRSFNNTKFRKPTSRELVSAIYFYFWTSFDIYWTNHIFINNYSEHNELQNNVLEKVVSILMWIIVTNSAASYPMHKALFNSCKLVYLNGGYEDFITFLNFGRQIVQAKQTICILSQWWLYSQLHCQTWANKYNSHKAVK